MPFAAERRTIGGSTARPSLDSTQMDEPISLDMMLDMFNMATKQLKPDFSDPMAYPKLYRKH